MPINTHEATKVWTRYAWARDNGHAKFVEKADLCERYFRGDQWDRADKAKLDLVRRPALTINKIISTISNVLGEQIYARAETSFRPRSGAQPDVADILTKVFRQIADANQLDWKRSDMFADGVITSRGYLDVRVEFDENMRGSVKIENFNPKNVIVDPDADEYDPDKWSEVFVSKWVTADDIALLYGKADADILRNRDQSYFPYGYDSIEAFRDRFGDRTNPMYSGDYDNSNVLRNIRMIERQYRVLDRQKYFVSTETGETRAIPATFDRNKIAFFVEKFGFQVTSKLVRRIKWTVIADNVLLHDDWSPYKHFTIVPYFPYFRRGTTIGLVENLIGSQELLNKVSSQELHVVNTTANSGWKVKAGNLLNMSLEELEQKGAQTGIVLEVTELDGVEKITPNQVPTGLDRVSMKAEEHIKTISGVSDSQQGMDRADVAAKAIQEKRKAGSTNLVKPMDSLTRSDFILARNVLDLVQEFYTEERMMTIVHDEATGASETFGINQPNPLSREEHAAQNPDTPYSEIVNDLTLGEYDVVVSSVPKRETLEDSQFEQAMALKEAGVAIPDSVLIESSRLINKKDILKAMSESPEAKRQQQIKEATDQATLRELQAKAGHMDADAGLKKAKTAEVQVKTEVLANTPIEQPQAPAGTPGLDAAVAEHEAQLRTRDQEHTENMDLLEHQRKVKEHSDKMALEAQKAAQERVDRRAAEAAAADAAAQKPQPQGKSK